MRGAATVDVLLSSDACLLSEGQLTLRHASSIDGFRCDAEVHVFAGLTGGAIRSRADLLKAAIQ
jgi:hypothetical protein